MVVDSTSLYSLYGICGHCANEERENHCLFPGVILVQSRDVQLGTCPLVSTLPGGEAEGCGPVMVFAWSGLSIF